jgi:hypothetical protein
MQYKLFRYSNAVYPRKYMESQEHVFAGFGLRKVLSTQLEKDPIGKEKFWNVEATIVKESSKFTCLSTKLI